MFSFDLLIKHKGEFLYFDGEKVSKIKNIERFCFNKVTFSNLDIASQFEIGERLLKDENYFAFNLNDILEEFGIEEDVEKAIGLLGVFLSLFLFKVYKELGFFNKLLFSDNNYSWVNCKKLSLYIFTACFKRYFEDLDSFHHSLTTRVCNGLVSSEYRNIYHCNKEFTLKLLKEFKFLDGNSSLVSEDCEMVFVPRIAKNGHTPIPLLSNRFRVSGLIGRNYINVFLSKSEYLELLKNEKNKLNMPIFFGVEQKTADKKLFKERLQNTLDQSCDTLIDICFNALLIETLSFGEFLKEKGCGEIPVSSVHFQSLCFLEVYSLAKPRDSKKPFGFNMFSSSNISDNKAVIPYKTGHNPIIKEFKLSAPLETLTLTTLELKDFFGKDFLDKDVNLKVFLEQLTYFCVQNNCLKILD